MKFEQLTLFEVSPTIVSVSESGTIQERFERFNRLNPWVFQAIERLASDWFSLGRKRMGIKMLWEVVRWQYARSTVDPACDFKINNNYHSRYVRLLIEKHPEWIGMFETRKLQSP